MKLENSSPGPIWVGTRSPASVRAFTLLEILIATAIFATVLIAMNTVFYAALRLERTTTRVVEESIPVNHALSVMKGDLRSILPPGGVFGGSITGGKGGSSMNSNLTGSSTLSSSSLGGALSTLQFSTTTGVMDDATIPNLVTIPEPWADTQKVSYYLRDVLNPNAPPGKELVRAVTRNLLPVLEELPSEQPLMSGVANLDFLFYDGTMWRDSWDSSTDTNSVLQAIKIQIELYAETRDEQLSKPPIELVVPMMTQARTNQPSSSGTSTQAQTSGGTTGGSGSGTPSTGGSAPNTSGGGGRGSAPQGGGGQRGGRG